MEKIPNNYTEQLAELSTYISDKFNSEANKNLLFHDLTHTLSVVKRADWLSVELGLNETDRFAVAVAAYFHDLGYLTGGRKDHEIRSVNEAKKYLENEEKPLIDKIESCILSTTIPQQPKNILEKIICDADLFHLGNVDFKIRNKLMKEESNLINEKKVSDAEWDSITLEFLQNHTFHTELCIKNLSAQKQENMDTLKKKIKKMEKKIKKKKAKNKDIPTRGIETMFRVSSSNQQRLSDMADNKAHILITTTSIIISVILSILFQQLEQNTAFIIPTFILLAVCVSTMVVSILATRPHIPSGRFTEKDVEDKKVNFLFFGNFFRMPYEDYNSGIQKLMVDKEFLYGNLTRDVYSQGIVLGGKYKLLRIAYNIFMYGIVASAMAFVFVVLMGHLITF